MANQCTKFEVSSFSRSGDILGGVRIFGKLFLAVVYRGLNFLHIFRFITYLNKLTGMTKYRKGPQRVAASRT